MTEGRTLASPALGYGMKKMAPSYSGVPSYSGNLVTEIIRTYTAVEIRLPHIATDKDFRFVEYDTVYAARYQCSGGASRLQLYGKLQNFATHNPVSAQQNTTQIFPLILPCLDYPEHGRRRVAKDGKPDAHNKRNHRKFPFFSPQSLKTYFLEVFSFPWCNSP